MRIIAGILVLVLLCVFCVAFAAEPERTNRALLIGVDLFVSRESTYPSSANNVQDMYRALHHSVLPFESIWIPEQSAASADQLAGWIQQAFSDAKEDDYNYLYISTHGEYDPGGTAVLLLSDGKVEDTVTAAALEHMFDGILGTNIIALDACYSGAFIGKGSARPPDTVHFQSPSFKVLTSSGAMEESWYWNGQADAGQGSFYFTQILTQGISPQWEYPADQNHNGDITLAELHRYLLQNHGASTPQVYPQSDDTVIFSYDTDTQNPDNRSPVIDVVFSDDSIDPGETIALSYTVLRPVRIAYQIVYRQNGHWQFDNTELIYDETERFTAFGDLAGVILPGRKERTISLTPNAEDLYGYVLIQLLTLENGRLTMQTGHVITVTPTGSELELSIDIPAEYMPGGGAELPIFVAHSLPCLLSVSVVDDTGATVRRISYRSASRPLNTRPDGSCFYWDGRDQSGKLAGQGEYRVLVEAWIGDTKITAESIPLSILIEEEEIGL